MDPFFYFEDDEQEVLAIVQNVENELTSATDTQDSASMISPNTGNFGK